MSYRAFDFDGFANDSKDILIKPRTYFFSIKANGSIVEPFIKTLIYCIVAGLISLLLHFVFLYGGAVAVFGGLSVPGLLISSIIGGLLSAFIVAFIILLISSICGGSTDFEVCFRVASSLMIIFPMSVLLPIFNDLSLILGLSINLFSVYLLYLGLVVALKGNPKRAKGFSFALVGLFLLLFAFSFFSKA